MRRVSRRRFLMIAGSAGVAAALPAFAATRDTYTWRGIALGAKAEIRLTLSDRRLASGIADACRAEIERLETIFSLYRSDSELARLNRDGFLDTPASDLLKVLSVASSIHLATGGVFDPTVQPQWRRLADRYAGNVRADSEADAIGFDGVAYTTERVAFTRPGMALTLNGIAQGYITDRVAGLLAKEGVTDTLVDVGELRALGRHPDGGAWPVRISGTSRTHGLKNRALTTSSGGGTTFDTPGRVGHIIHPASGLSAPVERQVTVEAPTATLADALSTAFCLMPREVAQETVAAFGQTRLIDYR